MKQVPPFIIADSIPEDRRIVTAAIVPFTSENEVVMFRHKNGLIEFIGGHIEDGESIEGGLRREAIEEGGVMLEEILTLVGYLRFDGSLMSYNPLYVSRVKDYVPIPENTESQGRLIIPFSDIIEFIECGPCHPWRHRHMEMMRFALKSIAEYR